ncbi:restriction endonuclease subunit S [Shewanella sp. SP2S2-4]|uniref:restriction endonuclease subunit S n=1 Tax=Shewanella sp. SP2S2-4 TaxID=3063539 RepID=UPI00288C7043|nr:restriction endonuclease subunit S [Shewanella sp. SP2S2-4]MDT3275100.1 restriction endonuclease subunit S [Shewanella sp. SP2S2-4]
MSGFVLEGWVDTQLGQIVDYGKAAKKTLEDVEPETWILELEDIEKDSSKLLSKVNASERPFKSTKNVFKKGDVLYGKLRPYLNKVIIAGSDGVCTTEIIPIDSEPFCLNRYLFYWLKSSKFLHYVDEVSYGVNMPRLGTKDANAAPFRLAPLAEQKVIADKLDELLAQVESTKAHLDAIPAILKSFRQSVLAAAVSGKLTEEWREVHELSSSIDYSVLVKEERKLKGFKETKHGKQAVVESEPFIIPYNWQWLRLGHIALKITDGAHNTPQVSAQGYPYLMAKNLTGGNLDFSENKCISEKEHRELFLKCLPEIGDLLVVNIGAGTGNNVLIDVEFEFSFKNIAIIKKPSFVIAKYLKHFFDAQKQRIFDEQTRGGAQPFLSLTVLNDIPFALPPINEQTEIVRRVEELFAFADKVEAQVNAAQTRVNNLTQSILAKAFRGELTADWRAANPELISGENSASALLKRIKAERAKLKPTKKTKA